jgi:DegV family protein with EDD domain
MSIGLSAESTIDLDQEHLDKYKISTLHFHVQEGDKAGFDNEFTNEALFEFTLKTGQICHTSACNVTELETHFAALHRQYDHLIHFTISSALSSGFNNACVASKGDPFIAVIDSHGTSGGIALLAIYAHELIEAGYDFDQVVGLVLERRKALECSFIIDRLDFLYKGGRCSKLALIGANILRLRPVIVCDAEGRFAIGKKYRGPTQKCIWNYVDDMLTDYPNIDKKLCFIDYATIEPATLAGIQERLRRFGFREIQTYQACPTNSYHAGPNAIGVHFLYDGEHPVKAV